MGVRDMVRNARREVWYLREAGLPLPPLLGEGRRIARQRQRYLVEVDQPLVLISQVQRSGGTLLSQLFDGHPQLHAHPHELYIGHPSKPVWPRLDLDASRSRQLRVLREFPIAEAFRSGYRKYDRGAGPAAAAHPFLLPPKLQRMIFLRSCPPHPEGSRQVLDAYFTSFFNAWLDNQNLYATPKVWITGFVPRMSEQLDSLLGFFGSYPDGRFVSVVREPLAWWTSARTHHESYRRPSSAAAIWCRSTAAALDARQRWGEEQVLLLAFEDLVGDTEATMRRVASWLAIPWDDVLVEPTFNGRPIEANSSFPVPGLGMRTEVLSRADGLEPHERDELHGLTSDVYEQALAALRPTRDAVRR